MLFSDGTTLFSCQNLKIQTSSFGQFLHFGCFVGVFVALSRVELKINFLLSRYIVYHTYAHYVRTTMYFVPTFFDILKKVLSRMVLCRYIHITCTRRHSIIEHTHSSLASLKTKKSICQRTYVSMYHAPQ